MEFCAIEGQTVASIGRAETRDSAPVITRDAADSPALRGREGGALIPANEVLTLSPEAKTLGNDRVPLESSLTTEFHRDFWCAC